MESIKRPKVGVGVIVIKDNKILLGKRKKTPGVGTWHYPGGHLEFGESWEECARREVKEETNLEIKNIKFITATNNISSAEDDHSITLHLRADYDSGELKNMEPNKCEDWEWFEWKNMPQPLFLSVENFVKQGLNPFNK